MIGRTLGHYHILAKLGAGGMGEVYRARDERLEREVALKILPAGSLGDEAARKRFRREALALSRLNHPNIAVIYDFDSDAGVDFLAMECVPGQTLAERLAGGTPTEQETVTLALQIAEGLEEAHEHGIVHRDLKPGNIMVTPKGRAKVLDFGLAKLLRTVEGTRSAETLPEVVAGTLPYMAPEQVRGEPVDARSDIFSLGSVVYEMATGRRAFGETAMSRLIDAILHQSVVPPRALNPRLSTELERILLKCLEKSPDSRYQSLREFSVDLRRLLSSLTATAAPRPAPLARQARRRTAVWSLGTVLVALVLAGLAIGLWRGRTRSPSGPRAIQSLAVLPLENFSGDPQQEYFADGMTEELITDLGKINRLRVISRTSVMQYKRTRKPIPEIASELAVDAVVEGSILQSQGRVRVTAQLIEARTDRHLWAQRYERETRDVLRLQDEIARAIAREIEVTLTPEEQARLASSLPVDPEANEAYLRGRFELRKESRDGNERAVG